MKLAILGGGGFRVPLVFKALMNDPANERVDEVRLFDVDARRQGAIASVLRALGDGVASAPRVVVCDNLPDAIRGIDFVFSAIRVGGTVGRAADERLCLHYGIIGQETVGAGGISYALRGLPVADEIGRTVAEHAPDAWVINFTNPAGVITQALRTHLGDHVVGICDSPVGLARRALDVLGKQGVIEPLDLTGALDQRVRIDYLGLNHLGWIRHLEVDGVDRLPELLARPDAIESFEEGRIFGAELLQGLHALPNEYLNYYYFTRELLAADLHADQPRGAFLNQQQSGFYDRASALDTDAEVVDEWERTRLERETTYMASNREALGAGERDESDLQTGGYDQVALAIMHAIGHDAPADLICNVANRGTISYLADDDVIEMPCRVDGTGIHPLEVSPLNLHQTALVAGVKQAEILTIEAARSGSRELARLALFQHPLVDSWRVAGKLLDDMMNEFEDLSYLR